MAKQVAFPVPKPVYQAPAKGKSGFGKIGSVLGAAAGLGAGMALAPATGGMSLATAGGIMGLAGGGAALGGLAGDIVAPATQGSQGGYTPLTQKGGVEMPSSNAMDRRAEILRDNPLLTLESSLKALPQIDQKLQGEYLPTLLTAYNIQSKQQGVV